MVVVAVVLVVIIVVMLLLLLALVIALAGVCPCLCSTCLMIRPHAMNGDAVFSLIVGGTCIPSRNFMGGARTRQLRACRRVHLLRRLHIRSLLAVFLLNFVFFPHGRRPYWRESLALFPHQRSTGTLGGQACLGWPRCFLHVASHSSRMGSCYLLGPPHMYNKLGLLREAPPPPPRMLAQQRSPNSRLSIVMSASSASPTLCAWVLSTCNRAHLELCACSKLNASPPNHRRMR